MATTVFQRSLILGLSMGCMAILLGSEIGASAWIQLHGSPHLDPWVQGISWSGEWALMALAIVGLGFHNRHWALAGLVAYAIESALSQIIKRWLNGPRPLRLQAWEMRSIEGEVWQEQLAMPSGHTAAAVLALWMLSRLPQTQAMGLQMLLGLWALAVGYSRIYLGQHSLDDVIAGACLGMVTGLIFDQVQKRAFDKSLLSP